MRDRHLTLTNWGAYDVETDGVEITAVHPFAKDPDPSPIGQSLKAVRRCRVMRPAIRQSWLEHGPGAKTDRRGAEPFVEVDWDMAIDLVGTELDRVISKHGNQAIYGGSYGWASAGRFHHAVSQIHRFLAVIGGYTSSVNTYSLAAGEVIVPHVVGLDVFEGQPSWQEISDNTQLFVTFGGVALKNAQVNPGGHGRHTTRDWLGTCRDRGAEFVNVSPLRDDMVETIDAEWIPARPNTDTAIMLGLAHSLIVEGLHDRRFIDRYCVGWDQLEKYLLGFEDGQPKTAEWAGAVADVAPARIRELARRMAGSRTFINVSWSVQRAHHGEQPYWMAIALAAMLGQIGLPGGGFGFGYGAVGTIGSGFDYRALPRLDRPPNPVAAYIPVSRIADMLLAPGAEFDYNGKRLTYPDVHLVYWCGGNPFHHHQEINRFLTALQKPDTIVVHEPFWNSFARHADVVLPATTPLERNDIGGGSDDDHIFWMERVLDPVGEARNDYDIFASLADRLGRGEQFTEGRTADEWIRYLYDRFQAANDRYPEFAELRAHGYFQTPDHIAARRANPVAVFRRDPEKHPLATPSGRIELYSETIAGYGYDDCPGHPTWMEPYEWLGTSELGSRLHLISNQPATRLHSQWDHGETSLDAKVAGREPIRIHPGDAEIRGISTGDVVRVFNERGACLAGAVVTDEVRPGVVQLSTGAWYDPEEPGRVGTICRHGNPNLLTRDAGTSRLAQGPTAQTCLVDVERYDGRLEPVGVFTLPHFTESAKVANLATQ